MSNRIKGFSLAAMLALSLGASISGASAQSAGGGGDGGGGSMGFDAPTTTHASVPGSTVPRQSQVRDENTFCGFELLRGHYCQSRPRR